MTTQRRLWAWLLGALVVVRLAASMALIMTADLRPDEEYYDEIAANLLSGYGFTHDPSAGPNLWRDPAYPVLLAGLMTLSSRSVAVSAAVVQTLLDVATAGLTFLFFRPLGLGVASVAAVLTWLNPLLVYYSLRVLSESLFTFLLTATLVALGKAAKGGTSPRVAAGVLCAGAILCRRSLVGFPMLAALWLARRTTGRDRLLTPSICSPGS